MFRNRLTFYGEGLLAPSPTHKLEDHHLSCVCGCLFYVFAATLRRWRPTLRPQPKDASCCVDKGPRTGLILLRLGKRAELL
jgi:hypothetical protein